MKTFVAALTLRFMDRLSGPSRSAVSAIGQLNRAQEMGRSASSRWSAGLEELDARLNRLASASLVTDGIGRAGEKLIQPLRAGVAAAAEFGQGMTGIGITAQMTDRQLQPMRRTILQTAREIGALPGTVQATFGAVLAEGVYTTEAELTRAGVAMARFQRLQAVMGEPLSDQEAGSFSAAMGSSLKLRADQLEGANAMVNRSAQQGGVSGATLARYLPSQTGGLVALKFATERGLADLLTANQLAKRLAGSSDQAGTNISNLMGKLASKDVLKNFSEAGINLEARIKEGVERGISPLETIAQLTRDATQGDQFKINELLGDVEARNGLMALVQNFDEFRAMSRELQSDDVLAGYFADLERSMQGPAAAFGRYTSGMSRMGIAVGTILAPAVGKAADALSGIAEWMSNASESGSALAKVAVWAVAGFAGFAVVAGAVGHAVVGVLGPMLIMKTLFGSLGGAAFKAGAAQVIGGLARMRIGMAAFNLTMLANPVVLAVAGAVAAIALVAVAVRKYWQPITAFFGGVGQALGEAFGPSLAAIGAALAPLRPLWDGLTRAVSGFFGWVGRLIQPMQATQDQLDGATNAGRSFGRMLVTVFNYSPVGLFVSSIRAGFGAVRTVMAWRPMETLRSAWSGLTGLGRSLLEGVTEAAQQGLRPLRALMSWRPAPAIQAAWSDLSGLGQSMMRGLARSVQAGLGMIRAVMVWRPAAVIRSAWSGLAGLARSVMRGLARSVQSGFGMVQAVMAWRPVGVVRAAWAGLGETIWSLMQGLTAPVQAGLGQLRAILNWRPASVVRAAWSGLGGVSRVLMQGLADSVQSGVRRLQSMMGWRPADMVRTAWSGLGAFARPLMRSLVVSIQSGFRLVRAVLAWRPMDTLRVAWSGVAGFFGGLQARFAGFGRALMQGLAGGIRSMLGEVRDSVLTTASSAVSWFKARLGIRSPSRVFAALGRDTMAGLTLGLDRSGRSAVGSIAAIGMAMIGAATGWPEAAPPPFGAAATPPAAPAEASASSRASGAPVITITGALPPFDPGNDPRDGRGPPPAAGATAYPRVQIDSLTIQVTVQGGGAGDARTLGRQIGRNAADAFRARLFDEA
jgi:hypothetical protein